MDITVSPTRKSPSFLDDLTLDSGLVVRRWTSDEFRRLSVSGILSADGSLEWADGEIVDCDSHLPYLFNRVEYYSLAEQGVLGPEERTELIYGRIITCMSPMSRPHSLSIVKTADTLEAAFGNNAAVEDQMPIHLESGSEPVPDVIVLRGSSQDYLEVPRPSDVLLLVEVSHSTLTYDRNTKAKIYAENGIAEYWIVNLRSRALEVYRQPEDSEYISLRVYDETAAVSPLAAPDALVLVADLLPISRG